MEAKLRIKKLLVNFYDKSAPLIERRQGLLTSARRICAIHPNFAFVQL